MSTAKPAPRVTRHGLEMPSFMYGTAWKEERTEGLVRQALAAGFRAIDTANQRKHYFEVGTGAAVAAAIDAGEVSRQELFLQTKFTYMRGQDHRLPYDPAEPLGEQVKQSFASSLEHLRCDYLDSYVLHGPAQRRGFSAADWQVWRAMEQLAEAGKTKLLGVSNIAPDQLQQLCAKARIKPAFVQNRCYARLGWDRAVRTLCQREGITYQGFSLLTANRDIFRAAAFQQIAARLNRTGPQVVFRFALQLGMLPLTVTCDDQHMREDLEVYQFELTPEDVTVIEGIATGAMG